MNIPTWITGIATGILLTLLPIDLAAADQRFYVRIRIGGGIAIGAAVIYWGISYGKGIDLNKDFSENKRSFVQFLGPGSPSWVTVASTRAQHDSWAVSDEPLIEIPVATYRW